VERDGAGPCPPKPNSPILRRLHGRHAEHAESMVQEMHGDEGEEHEPGPHPQLPLPHDVAVADTRHNRRGFPVHSRHRFLGPESGRLSMPDLVGTPNGGFDQATAAAGSGSTTSLGPSNLRRVSKSRAAVSSNTLAINVLPLMADLRRFRMASPSPGP